jgi:hypothetical protein
MTNMEMTFFQTAYASGVALLVSAAILDIREHLRRRRVAWLIRRLTGRASWRSR